MVKWIPFFAIFCLMAVGCTHNPNGKTMGQKQEEKGLSEESREKDYLLPPLGEDLGIRFSVVAGNHQSGVCISSKGKQGYNPGRIDECGDLTLIRPSDRWGHGDKDDFFVGRYLRGAKMSSLDLTNLDFAGTDLRDCDLKGANLGGSHLWFARLQGAQIDDKTIFPFSPPYAKAVIEGKFKEYPKEYVGELATPLVGSEGMVWGEYLETLKQQFHPSVAYYRQLRAVIRDKKEFSLGELVQTMEAVYYPTEKVVTWIQEKRNQSIEAAFWLGAEHNGVLYEGLKRINELKLVNERLLLLRQVAFNLPDRVADSLREGLVKKLVSTYPNWPSIHLREAIEIVNRHQLPELSYEMTKNYLQRFGEGKWNKIIKIIKLLRFEAKDMTILHVLDQQSKITTEELLQLKGLAFKVKGEVLANYLGKVSDLDLDNFMLLLQHSPLVYRTAMVKDFIKYNTGTDRKTGRSKKIDLSNFSLLVQSIPDHAIEVTSYLSKIEQWDFNELIQFLPLISDTEAEKVVFYYIEKVVNQISIDRLIVLSQWCIKQKDKLLSGYLQKINAWSFDGALQLVVVAEKSSRTKIVNYYVKTINPKISPEERELLLGGDGRSKE